MEQRWKIGVYLGNRDETGEAIVGTADGVFKAWDMRRRGTEEDRWDKEIIGC